MSDQPLGPSDEEIERLVAEARIEMGEPDDSITTRYVAGWSPFGTGLLSHPYSVYRLLEHDSDKHKRAAPPELVIENMNREQVQHLIEQLTNALEAGKAFDGEG